MTMVLVSHVDNIATIVLNRPEKCNALDGALISELATALKNASEDKQIGVIILKAQGDHFCAGADIAWMQKMAQSSKEENSRDAMLLAALIHLIYTLPKPVIVVTQGMTLGGGLGIVAAADIVIAANNASFCFSEVKIGLAPSIVSPYVIAAIGERAARYYFLTAERFGVEQAQHLGLVHHIVEQEALASAGLALARTLLQHGPVAMMEAKHLTQVVTHERITVGLNQFTAEHLAKLRASTEASEGLQAFLEKRLPRWM